MTSRLSMALFGTKVVSMSVVLNSNGENETARRLRW